MKQLKSGSFSLILLIGVVLSIYRLSIVDEREISWDTLGYYLPLPATFIHNDPMLNDISWLEKVNEERELTGTLYMISSNDKGENMYFFLFGMSALYAPFFFGGHVAADVLGYPMDGFSLPYHYALVFGSILYMLIGLFYFRKILRTYFSEFITSAVILITVFSTNYIHHSVLKNLETVNYLFMLICIVVWFTMQWHKTKKLKHIVAIGAAITLIALVKPSEVVIVLVPLFWGLSSKKAVREKLSFFVKYKWQFLIAIGVCLLIASPQMLYWYTKTGTPIYDSYKNPGVGLDLAAPHILDSLFSYRKGWLVYTPVMIFYLWGLRALYRENRSVFVPVILYFLLTFYIITSWSEWWYGAAFSNRPLIATYPLLAIGFGYFLTKLQQQKPVFKNSFLVILLAFTALNQFQWWQLKNSILDPYRTTKDYFWATFLSTSVTEEDKELLMVRRDFSGKMEFRNPQKYHTILLDKVSFGADSQRAGSPESDYFKFPQNEFYTISQKHAYESLTRKDHLWAKISVDIKFPPDFDETWPCVVMTMEREEGVYGYFAPSLKPDSLSEEWINFTFEYLTPPIRNKDDILNYFIWKRGETSFEVDNFTVEIFEENDK